MQRISSEFAGFVRDTAVRAFDRLTEKQSEVGAPLRPILRAWNKLSDAQKSELFDELIATVQTSDAHPVAMEAKPSPKKAIRRFAPEEVEPTLPKKPKKKAGAKKKKAPAGKS